jgi:hypothetical protein
MYRIKIQHVFSIEILQDILLSSAEHCTSQSLPPSGGHSTHFNPGSVGPTPDFWYTQRNRELLGRSSPRFRLFAHLYMVVHPDDSYEEEEEGIWIISCTVLDRIFDQPSAEPTELRHRQT